MNKLRIGQIGAGYWGEKLLRVFTQQTDICVPSICDRDESRLAGQFPDERVVTTSVAALLSDPKIDAVAIATPPSTHYALAREALQAGKHCWVEKPLALRAAEAKELVTIAQQQGRILFVDETFLYDPLIQKVKQWIEAGRLGRLYHLSFERLGQGRIRRDSNVWWNSAPHDLSMLCHLVPGAVESVHMEGFSYLQPGIADFTAGTVCLEGGVSAHIYLSWLSPLKVASMSITGSLGMLHFEGRFGKRKVSLYEYRITDPATVTENLVPFENFSLVEEVTGGDEEPLALAVRAFVKSIRTGVPAPSAGRYSQRVVEILESAGL